MRTYLTSNPTYYLLHPWVFFTELYKEIKAFFQRGLRGYADCDLWSLGWYLMDWLPKALRQFSRDTMSYPNDLTPKKWTKILNEMADGFEAPDKCEEIYFSGEIKPEDHLENVKVANKQLQRSLKLFTKYFTDLWD